jgi:hypothetical protein
MREGEEERYREMRERVRERCKRREGEGWGVTIKQREGRGDRERWEQQDKKYQ